MFTQGGYLWREVFKRDWRRWMGGPSSHLKQLKGLIRKAHLTLPMEDERVKQAYLDHTSLQLQEYLKHTDVERVPPCDRPSCRSSPEGLWCSIPVAFPPRNWQTVFNARGKTMRELEVNLGKLRRVRKFVLPENVMIFQPGSRKRTYNGLDKLTLAMLDNVLSIDMQWNTPDSKVGIFQVATSTFSLLIRGLKFWDRGMPPELDKLFRDPSLITVGFGFDETDQEKLYQSFGWRMEDFSNFIDLQHLAAQCGYPSDISLATLSQKVLGIKPHVELDFASTDWEAERLTANESLYASLSVFAIGQTFRQLRHWHALPRRCANCQQELGIFYDHKAQCVLESCSAQFSSLSHSRKHCLLTGHPYHSQLCSGCYRFKPISEQIRSESTDGYAVENVSIEDGLGREVVEDVMDYGLQQSHKRYRECLVELGPNLTRNLYGNLS